MPAPAAQSLVRSSRVRLMVAGTPSATPEYGPKLGRMSPRTTPESVRTFGPLEPSPGNGPAVSADTGFAHAVAPAGWFVAEAIVVVGRSPRTHAASAEAPAAPARYRMRRLDSVLRS